MALALVRRHVSVPGAGHEGSTDDEPPLGDLLPPEALAPVLEQSQHENFPVASRLLPRAVRDHLMAVYGFARLVDDIGDEAPGDRGALLDLIDAEIDRIYSGWPQPPQLPLMRTLARTVHACRIPPGPLRRLVAANRQDQTVARYPTYDDLVAYCTLSANPVGEIVLYVFGRADPARIALSDRICTALQLAEHWQDVAEDLARGRVYLPQEDLDRWACTEADLARPSAPPQVRRLMAFEVDRARRLLDEGTPLVGRLPGFARVAVAGYVAGGRAALTAITDADYDVLRTTPRPAKQRLVREWLRLLAGGGRR